MPQRRSSDAAKQSAGTYTPTRHHAQPRYAPQAPRMPASLSKEAQEIWRDLVPELAAAKVLTRIDGHALVALCNLLVRYYKSEEKGHKPFTASDLTQLRMLFAEFGMTPASRLRTPPLVVEDPPVPTWQNDEQLRAKAEASGKVIRMSSRLSAISRKSMPAKSTPAATSD